MGDIRCTRSTNKEHGLHKLIFIFLFVTILLIASSFIDLETVKIQILEFRNSNIIAVTLICTLIYSILLAIPFVAGAEIGILMMILLGTPGVVGAYLGTLFGLSIALYLGSSSKIDSTKFKKALDHTFNKFSQYVPRWAVLAILINIPGNTLLGGGGGIAMAFGAEKKIGTLKFLSVILIATLFYFGLIQLTA